MKSFQEWLHKRTLLESKDSNGRELIKLCRKEPWIDNDGVEATFIGWEEGKKENKIVLRHPIVGDITLTVSRRPFLLASQILTHVQTDYRNRVATLKELQAKRKKAI